MKHKATAGDLQLTHNQLRRLLLGDRIKVSIENSRRANYTYWKSAWSSLILTRT
jgi:hypothetical protein